MFKKKKEASAKEPVLEVENKAEDQAESLEVKKTGPFSRFRHIKEKYRLKIKFKKAGSAKGDEADGDPKEDETPEEKPKKAKKVKAPKVKKPKVAKKAPKKTPKKVPKKEKKTDNEDGTENGKKKKPVLLFVIIGVVVIAGAVAAFLLLNKAPSAPDTLSEAASLMAEEKYEEAGNLYQKILDKDDKNVEAHLGLAESYVKRDDTATALEKLGEALEKTDQNQQIKDRIDELTQEPGAEENADAAVASPGTTAIVWSDPAFEKMLRLALGKTAGEPISQTDLLEVSQLFILGETHAIINEPLKQISRTSGYEIDGVLHTERGNITKLDDIANFKNLNKLVIGYNSINDISGAANAAGLETLSLNFNNINDISALKSLKNLAFFYAAGNQITDISPLAELTNLKHLWLTQNDIVDISAVKNLTQLSELYIDDNKVVDISPVSGLTKLKFFHAQNNRIEDISVTKNMESLTDTSFAGNPLSKAG